MRPNTRLAILAYAAVICLAAWPAHAQSQMPGGPDDPGNPDSNPDGSPGGPSPQSDDDDKTRKRNEEWGKGSQALNLPQLRNAGPCPYVKVLYDAARYVELKDNQPASGNVGFTGEIDNLASACEYKNDDPIKVQARILFELGRGPLAQGDHKTYRYWVAVTDRNRAVLEKQYFDLPVVFPAGADRVSKTEDILGIVIPRADLKVSGGNFEVLVGFDVTQDMADFNRDGSRFRPDAGVATADAGPTAGGHSN